MKYDDLINIPFKKFGRDKKGYDCYGLVMECCRRAGTPLVDLYNEVVDVPAEKVNEYVRGGLNLKEIPAPKVGAITYSIYKGNAHVGYIVERNKVLHATDRGVKVSPLQIMHIIKFYEVTK